jgi:hypothetical protein
MRLVEGRKMIVYWIPTVKWQCLHLCHQADKGIGVRIGHQESMLMVGHKDDG